MSEETLKATNVEVLRIKLKDNPKAPVDLQVRDLDKNIDGWMKYWPTLERGTKSIANPATIMETGGKYRVGVFNQTREFEGKTYTDWYIKECEPLATPGDAAEVFRQHAYPEAPRSPAQAVQPQNRAELALTDKDRLILAQNAYRHASVLESSMIVSMGHEAYEKDGGVNRVKLLAYDMYNGILELAKNDGNHFGK